MAVNPQPKIFNIVPGNGADTDEIQEEASSEIFNWTNFFPSIYEVPRKSGGLSPERRTLNAIFKDYGGHLYFMQRGGIYAYDASQRYAKGSVIQYGGSLYAAIADNGAGTDAGAVAPGSSTSVWQKLLIETNLSAYAKTAWVSANYELQSHASATYATITWVNGNFATTSWVNTYFLTKSAAQQTYGAITWINALDANAVHKNGNETIDDVKTFRQTIQGNISGNAQTATVWQTARTITLSNAVSATAQWINGSGNVNIPVNSLDASKLTGTASVNTTGRASWATNANNDETGSRIANRYYHNAWVSGDTLYLQRPTGSYTAVSISTHSSPMGTSYNSVGSTIVAGSTVIYAGGAGGYGDVVAGSNLNRPYNFDQDGGGFEGNAPVCPGTWIRVSGITSRYNGKYIGTWRRIA